MTAAAIGARRDKYAGSADPVFVGGGVRLRTHYEPFYGGNPDDQCVAEAVRASLSIPIDIDPEGKDLLIRSGRQAAEAFLRGWSGDDGRAGSERFPLPAGRPRTEPAP